MSKVVVERRKVRGVINDTVRKFSLRLARDRVHAIWPFGHCNSEPNLRNRYLASLYFVLVLSRDDSLVLSISRQ